MLIPWSTILIVLMPSGFILVHSRALPMSYEESQQWIDSVVDGANGGTPRDDLLGSPFKVSATEPSGKTRKIPIYLDRQMIFRKRHRRGIGGKASSEKKDHQRKKCTFANLLKNANIRIAEEDSVIAARCSRKTGVDAARRNFTHFCNSNDSAGNTTVEHSTVAPLNISFQISSNDAANRASNNRGEQRSIRCQVIGDIYITDVNEKVPSYACKLGNNTFFLSSKRFSHDRTYNLDVSVDDDTLRRLNNDSFVSAGSIPHVIEVVLALKSDGEDYEIHHRRTEL